MIIIEKAGEVPQMTLARLDRFCFRTIPQVCVLRT